MRVPPPHREAQTANEAAQTSRLSARAPEPSLINVPETYHLKCLILRKFA